MSGPVGQAAHARDKDSPAAKGGSQQLARLASWVDRPNFYLMILSDPRPLTARTLPRLLLVRCICPPPRPPGYCTVARRVASGSADLLTPDDVLGQVGVLGVFGGPGPASGVPSDRGPPPGFDCLRYRPCPPLTPRTSRTVIMGAERRTNVGLSGPGPASALLGQGISQVCDPRPPLPRAACYLTSTGYHPTKFRANWSRGVRLVSPYVTDQAVDGEVRELGVHGGHDACLFLAHRRQHALPV